MTDTKCQFFLKGKNRRCKLQAQAGQQFCGNHGSATQCNEASVMSGTPSQKPQEGQTSEGMKARNTRQDRPQTSVVPPYFREGCNAGSGPPAELSVKFPSDLSNAEERGGSDPVLAACKSKSRNNAERIHYALAMNPAGFGSFLGRIKAAYAENQAYEGAVRDESTRAKLQPDRERPFSLRHAMQQASIVGNMERVGLLQEAEGKVFVEYGAGKGYLSSMLSDLSPARDFLLVDNQSFRHKAERSLRKTSCVERLRMDIKDFYAPGHTKLKEKPWIAIGKHLCGAATDFCLRSCTQSALTPGGEERVKGLAVAPCCHHRCSWKHYTGQNYFTSLGFSPAEFEVISWMTGWAMCGHESPAGTSTAESLPDGQVGVPAQRNDLDSEILGLTVDHQQNKIEEGSSHGQGQSNESEEVCHRKRSKKQRQASARGRAENLRALQLKGPETREAGCDLHNQPSQSALGNPSESPNESVPEEKKDVILAGRKDQASGSDCIEDRETASDGHFWFPGSDLAVSEKMQIGHMCKRLIDAGRIHFLGAELWQVELVAYVDPGITGENKLFLAQPSNCKQLYQQPE